MKNLLKPNIYWLFLFIPIAVFLDHSHASAPLIFFSAALSIIPIARLIGNSTEQPATYTGDAIGGLLNATFGNLPELIIAVIALNAGLHEMVLASLAGAISIFLIHRVKELVSRVHMTGHNTIFSIPRGFRLQKIKQ